MTDTLSNSDFIQITVYQTPPVATVIVLWALLLVASKYIG